MADKVACKNCKYVVILGVNPSVPYPSNAIRCTNLENKLDDIFDAYNGTDMVNPVLPLCQDINHNGKCEYFEE